MAPTSKLSISAFAFLRSPVFRAAWALGALFLAAVLSGCSPGYVFRAAYEEVKILWRREPIEEILRRGELDRETREKLELVLAVREYAAQRLRFRVGGSYATHSTTDRAVLTHVLMAAPQTSLSPHTWWFLFVGSVPYKGFFSEQTAQAEARSFQTRGYDTLIRPSPAFSTLGWFDDPLLGHLLRYDKATLAKVVFHELFHNTLFIKGAVDFNESMANFIGNRAAVLFLREHSGSASPEAVIAVQRWEEELEFSSFIAGVAAALEELYRGDIPEEEKLRRKEEIFALSQKEWSDRIASRPNHLYRGYARQKLNNALMAHYLLYGRGLDLFESIYQAKGEDLPEMVGFVWSAVRNGGPPFDALRATLDGSR
jgi:predicted aminopeptidase